MTQTFEKISILLIYKKISDELNEEETKLFQAWIEESIEHKAYFEKIKYYYENCLSGEVSENEVDEAWGIFVKKTNFQKRISRRNMFYKRSVAVAIIIVMIGLVGTWAGYFQEEIPVTIGQTTILPGQHSAILELANGITYQLGNLSQQKLKCIGENIVVDSGSLSYTKVNGTQVYVEEYNKLSIPRGGEYQIRLEDGTKVWLNSESQLRYPSSFRGQKREVFLEGEAYFEVVKDSLRPFVVHAGVQNITVLGTSFGITNYKGEPAVSTTLVEGQVKVEFPDYSADTFVLHPGYQISFNYTNQQIEKKRVDIREFVAWHEGRYVFSKKRLEDILNTLSRWYDFQVFYQNPDAKEVLFSGELMRFENFNDLLHLIEKTSDVKFDMDRNTVLVRK